MVIEYIRYEITAERQRTFLEAYANAAKSLMLSEYCLGYELTQCEEKPERFILRIEWTSTDDHLKIFRPSADFREFFSHIRPYVDDIEEMHHYGLTPIVGS